jgi:hypothetical protein
MTGICMLRFLAALIMPSAMTSHLMMPPKMLTKIADTFGSDKMILKASYNIIKSLVIINNIVDMQSTCFS